MARATDHLVGGPQCACRRNMLKNRKGLPVKFDYLTLLRDFERETFKWLYNRRLRIFSTRCKDSKTLQLISSLSKLEKEVTQRRGQELITVECPTDITAYQHNIDGVDRGDKFHKHNAGFSGKDQFKKCYKRGHFELCDFGFLNLHIAWNMSCDMMVQRGQ